MRERPPRVQTAEIPQHVAVLPDTPYALWASGELHDYLHLPHDGTRVEVIGGRVVVSPPPGVPHGGIVQDVADAVSAARSADPEFAWRTLQVTGIDYLGAGDGYIPDLVVLAAEALDRAREADLAKLAPDEIELVVEVTSRRGAENDLPPADRRTRTKWNWYAHAEIPYYLLVDRSPKAGRTTLYSIPDQGAAAYLHQESWDFGETVRLPEPFGLDIATGLWKPWKS